MTARTRHAHRYLLFSCSKVQLSHVLLLLLAPLLLLLLPLLLLPLLLLPLLLLPLLLLLACRTFGTPPVMNTFRCSTVQRTSCRVSHKEGSCVGACRVCIEGSASAATKAFNLTRMCECHRLLSYVQIEKGSCYVKIPLALSPVD